MNEEIHVDHPACSGGHVTEHKPGIDQGQGVMNPVEIDQGSLAQNDEHGVHELWCLRQGKRQVPCIHADVLQQKQNSKKQSKIYYKHFKIFKIYREACLKIVKLSKYHNVSLEFELKIQMSQKQK